MLASMTGFGDARGQSAGLSVHVEVLPHLHRTIGYIKSLGARAGAVLNPSTPIAALEEVAGDVDFVLVMSVNPGFGGQVFIPRSVDKIRHVRGLLDRAGNTSAPVEARMARLSEIAEASMAGPFFAAFVLANAIWLYTAGWLVVASLAFREMWGISLPRAAAFLVLAALVFVIAVALVSFTATL